MGYAGFDDPTGTTGSPTLSVTELTAQIKARLERAFAQIRVHGEISRLTRHRSGHIYFTIKDEHAAIAAVIWRSTAARLTCQPVEGASFVFSGSIGVYEPRGTYQLIVRHIAPLGAGRLAAEFERRKQCFAQRGWFDAARKRAIPPLPQHIGIATSPSGAALQDVRKVLATRPAWLRLTLAPCQVQGAEAPASIAHALQRLGTLAPDVILLVRGGGSMEDLWCFNDEQVVRAMVDCPVPIITGIGHEIDTTLADLAADMRAATPSNAAELACPARDELRRRLVPVQRLQQLLRRIVEHRQVLLHQRAQRARHSWQRAQDQRQMRLQDWQQRLHVALHTRLHGKRRHLGGLERRLARQAPAYQLKQRQKRLQDQLTRLRLAMRQIMRHRQRYLAQLRTRLHDTGKQPLSFKRRRLQPIEHRLLRLQLLHPRILILRQVEHALAEGTKRALARQRAQFMLVRGKLLMLDPTRVLARGYTITCDAQGRIITQAARISPAALLQTRFQDGTIVSRVIDRNPAGEQT